MALIKCPECAQMVSDQANACVHCGYPIANYIQQMAEQQIIGENGLTQQNLREFYDGILSSSRWISQDGFAITITNGKVLRSNQGGTKTSGKAVIFDGKIICIYESNNVCWTIEQAKPFDRNKIIVDPDETPDAWFRKQKGLFSRY